MPRQTKQADARIPGHRIFTASLRGTVQAHGRTRDGAHSLSRRSPGDERPHSPSSISCSRAAPRSITLDQAKYRFLVIRVPNGPRSRQRYRPLPKAEFPGSMSCRGTASLCRLRLRPKSLRNSITTPSVRSPIRAFKDGWCRSVMRAGRILLPRLGHFSRRKSSYGAA